MLALIRFTRLLFIFCSLSLKRGDTLKVWERDLKKKKKVSHWKLDLELA